MAATLKSETEAEAPEREKSPEEILGGRLLNIRKYLAAARERDGNVSPENFLLTQIAVLLIDILECQAEMVSQQQETNACLMEIIVHRKPI